MFWGKSLKFKLSNKTKENNIKTSEQIILPHESLKVALTIVLGQRGAEILPCRTTYKLAVIETPDIDMEGLQTRKNFGGKNLASST